jgi:hypothetical protein
VLALTSTRGVDAHGGVGAAAHELRALCVWRTHAHARTRTHTRACTHAARARAPPRRTAAGKTTTIRALADLLPEVPVVAKDPFNSGAAPRAARAPAPRGAACRAFFLAGVRAGCRSARVVARPRRARARLHGPTHTPYDKQTRARARATRDRRQTPTTPS